jgi:hypothetical protein
MQEVDPEKKRLLIDDRPTAILSVKEDKVDTGYPPNGLYIAFALLIIFFSGEPDLVDALIHFFMAAK